MWACVGLAGIVAIVWLASGWYVVGIYRTDRLGTKMVQVNKGRLVCYSSNIVLRDDNGLRVDGRDWEGWAWRFESRHANTVGVRYRMYLIPLWPAFVAAGAGAAGLWGLGCWVAARNKGRCSSCGYDLSGLGGSAACPECGTKPEGTRGQRRAGVQLGP
jgi:hypothetical protein